MTIMRILLGFLAIIPISVAQAQSKLPPCELKAQVGDWFILASGLSPTVWSANAFFQTAENVELGGASVSVTRLIDATQKDSATGEPVVKTSRHFAVNLFDATIDGAPVTKETRFELHRINASGNESTKIGSIVTLSSSTNVLAESMPEADLMALSDTGEVIVDVYAKRPDDADHAFFSRFYVSSTGLKDALAEAQLLDERLKEMVISEKCEENYEQ